MATQKRGRNRYTQQELLAELANQVWRTGDFRRRGISYQRLRRLVQRGLLRQLGKGVFCAPDTTGPDMLRGLQRCFPHVVFGGRTARQLWQDQEITLPLSVHVPHGSRLTTRAGLFRVRQTRGTPSVQQHGVRVTPPCWSLTDTPETPDQAEFLEQQYQGHRGRSRFEQHRRLRKWLPNKLRSALDACAVGADSPVERTVFHGLRRRGLHFELNTQVFGYRWDLASHKHRILVEIDGFEFHALQHERKESRAQFITDRWKADAAVVQGWLVLRFSGSCVRHHLGRVLDMVGHAVALRRSGRHTQEVALEPPWAWHQVVDPPHDPLGLGFPSSPPLPAPDFSR